MARIQLKVSLEGQCRNAADTIERLTAKVRELSGWVEEIHGETVDDPADGGDYYAFALREIADHAKGLAAGDHEADDFLDFYCLKPQVVPVEVPNTEVQHGS
jgi:uncharacterized protein (UPF0335 family)